MDDAKLNSEYENVTRHPREYVWFAIVLLVLMALVVIKQQA